jgi:hypothetical protein
MSSGERIVGDTSPVQIIGVRAELLDEPYTIVPDSDPATSLRILAHSVSQEGDVSVAGYVATKPGRSIILGEFSGEPTGEVMPCNAVKGFVGEGRVYDKNVSTDTPLAGLRTIIAQRRAAKAVKRNLK